MSHSLKAIKFEGIISIIGLLSGSNPPDNIMEPLKRICTLRGIFVGSGAHMEDMMAGIEANRIQPVVDQRIFTLEEGREAFRYLVS
jgi:NADPH:quinone reductase-like Zn-dependent oxidoreductase